MALRSLNRTCQVGPSLLPHSLQPTLLLCRTGLVLALVLLHLLAVHLTEAVLAGRSLHVPAVLIADTLTSYKLAPVVRAGNVGASRDLLLVLVLTLVVPLDALPGQALLPVTGGVGALAVRGLAAGDYSSRCRWRRPLPGIVTTLWELDEVGGKTTWMLPNLSTISLASSSKLYEDSSLIWEHLAGSPILMAFLGNSSRLLAVLELIGALSQMTADRVLLKTCSLQGAM